MRQYIIRRIILSIFTLFGVSLILYALARLMPADYIETITAGRPNITPEMKANLRSLYGLDTGILQGYFNWITGVLSGDLGTSFVYARPVTEVIGERIKFSLYLFVPAVILQYLIAIPLGIISATKQYSKADYTITVIALIGISLPSFFFAALLQKIFAIDLRILPLQGMVTARYDYQGFDLFLDMAKHFTLPIIVLTITSIGEIMRYVRTNMLEVLNSDYIRTARAKGLNENVVIYKHAFRNTLILIVTLTATVLPSLFSGAMITEKIFGIDGLGTTAFTAVQSGDIPFIMAFNMFITVLTLLGMLIADILYSVVDPRIRLS